MRYSPHILQVKTISAPKKDEFGRIISKGGEEWKDVCTCRCDDNSTKEFTSENGHVFRPAYHIVCDGHVSVKAGEEVRCVKGEEVRGLGKVYMVKHLNFLNYSELWV